MNTIGIYFILLNIHCILLSYCTGKLKITKYSLRCKFSDSNWCKVGSVIDRDFWVLKIGKIMKYTGLYIQLSTLCIVYSDMML